MLIGRALKTLRSVKRE